MSDREVVLKKVVVTKVIEVFPDTHKKIKNEAKKRNISMRALMEKLVSEMDKIK